MKSEETDKTWTPKEDSWGSWTWSNRCVPCHEKILGCNMERTNLEDDFLQ